MVFKCLVKFITIPLKNMSFYASKFPFFHSSIKKSLPEKILCTLITKMCTFLFFFLKNVCYLCLDIKVRALSGVRFVLWGWRTSESISSCLLARSECMESKSWQKHFLSLSLHIQNLNTRVLTKHVMSSFNTEITQLSLSCMFETLITVFTFQLLFIGYSKVHCGSYTFLLQGSISVFSLEVKVFRLVWNLNIWVK